MQNQSIQILVVDDEESISWALQQGLSNEGWKVQRTATAEAALSFLKENAVDLVVLDVRLPGIDGMTAMTKMREQQPELPIIIMTAFGTLNVAISAMRSVATEYLTKPFELQEVIRLAKRCLEVKQKTNHAEYSVDVEESTAEGIIGKCPAMQEVFKKIALVSNSDLPVLITGESGTGKELVARALHRHSKRAEFPLFPVHLAALSSSLIESELFGHAKGSFTGADRDRQGILEMAHGATVFFDEAGDIPLNIQVKLLRALEQHEVLRVGDSLSRTADFRVITATNCDMAKALEQGRIRQDFYFRISGFVIALPPLRERKDDIPILANHFLRNITPQCTFSSDAMNELVNRNWAGNVRELRQVVECAAIFARNGEILMNHLPGEQANVQSVATQLVNAVKRWTHVALNDNTSPRNLYSQFLAEAEPTLIAEVLNYVANNRTLAAEYLGLDRATLRKKLGNSLADS